MKAKLVWTSVCCLVLCAGYAAEAKTETAAWDIFEPLNGVKTRCGAPVKNKTVQLVKAKSGGFWIFPARKDFTPYNALAFEIEANGKPGAGNKMGLVIRYGEPKANSYYLTKLDADFTGRKKFVIPFADMSPNRNPKLDNITMVSFTTGGWDLKAEKDFVATIGNIRLLKLTPEEMKAAAPAEWNLLSPLGGKTARCAVPVKNNSFQLIREKNASVSIQPARTDFTPYTALAFDIEARDKEQTKTEMGILIRWKNPNPKVDSYFMQRLPIDFTGKKSVVIPFGKMSRTRNPQLNPIARVSFTTSGWGLKAGKDFVATISNVRLLKTIPSGKDVK